MNKRSLMKWKLLTFFLCLMIFFSIIIGPWIMSLLEDQEAFRELVNSWGVGGVFFMIILIITQILLAFIPGEPLEIAAGMMYGAFGGLLLCMVGSLLGTIIVYYLVKKGKKLFGTSSLSFLKQEKNIELIVFILFFIPGTPKDALTYAVPFTEIKAHRFFLIATIARIPSIITSTSVGGALITGEYKKVLVIFIATGIASIIGIIANQIYLKNKQKKD